MSAAWTHKPAEAGFTLIELLVAMTLFGLVMVLAFGGLRFGARAWEAIDAIGSRAIDTAAVQTMLRRQLAAAQATADERRGTMPLAPFVGSAATMRFLAPAPARAALPGIYEHSLTVAPCAGGATLIMAWQRRPSIQNVSRAANPDQTVLVPCTPAMIDFAYFGALTEADAPRWRQDWQNADRLPKLIRIRVKPATPGASFWPDLLVAPQNDPEERAAP